MIDFRTSGIFAGAAFILSLALGIFSGAAFPMIILRPLIFALIFFGIAAFGKHLISKFLPELLNDEIGAPGPVSGKRVNITEDFSFDVSSSEDYMQRETMHNTPRPSPLYDAALPKPTAVGMGDNQDGLGNISELLRQRADRTSRPEQSKNPAMTPTTDFSLESPPVDTPPAESQPFTEPAMQPTMENQAPADLALDEKSGYNKEGELSPPDKSGEIPMWDFDNSFKPGMPQGLPGASVEVYESKDQNNVKAEPSFTSDFPRDFPREFPKEIPKETPQGEDKGGAAGDADLLPDLDTIAGAFKQPSMENEQEAVDYNVPSSSASGRGLPRTSESSWAGNFNPKDIAMGLQTILTKEKEG